MNLRIYRNEYTAVCNGPCLCCHGIGPEFWDSMVDFAYDEMSYYAVWRSVMALEKRRPTQLGSGGGVDPWVDPDFKADWPNVFAFMHDQEWADKSPRVPGSISLFCQQGTLKAAVNDKDRLLVAFVTATTFPELMTLIDLGICKDSLDWRSTSGPPNSRKPTF